MTQAALKKNSLFPLSFRISHSFCAILHSLGQSIFGRDGGLILNRTVENFALAEPVAPENQTKQREDESLARTGDHWYFNFFQNFGDHILRGDFSHPAFRFDDQSMSQYVKSDPFHIVGRDEFVPANGRQCLRRAEQSNRSPRTATQCNVVVIARGMHDVENVVFHFRIEMRLVDFLLGRRSHLPPRPPLPANRSDARSGCDQQFRLVLVAGINRG